jgi:hypothetical protein
MGDVLAGSFSMFSAIIMIALEGCLSRMLFPENLFPLFRIML